jgi:hypothetical protein
MREVLAEALGETMWFLYQTSGLYLREDVTRFRLMEPFFKGDRKYGRARPMSVSYRLSTL